jgi:Meckel syndrome type 1 protein
MIALPTIVPVAAPAFLPTEPDAAPFAAIFDAVCQHSPLPPGSFSIEARGSGPAFSEPPSVEPDGADAANRSMPDQTVVIEPTAGLPVKSPVTFQPQTGSSANESSFDKQPLDNSAPSQIVDIVSVWPQDLPLAIQRSPAELPGSKASPLPGTPAMVTTANANKRSMSAIRPEHFFAADAATRPSDTNMSIPAAPHRMALRAAETVGQPASIDQHEPSITSFSQPVAAIFQLPGQPDVTPTAPLTKIAASPLLDLTQDIQWVETLARDIAASATTDGKLSFRLIPEYLGKLDISLIREPSHVDVRIETQNDMTARIISTEQPRLIEELRLSGIRVGEFAMTASQGDGSTRQHPPQQPQPQRDLPHERSEKAPTPKRNDRFA